MPADWAPKAMRRFITQSRWRLATRYSCISSKPWQRSFKRAVSNRSASPDDRRARSKPTDASLPPSSLEALSLQPKRCVRTYEPWQTSRCSGGSRNPPTMSTPAPNVPEGPSGSKADACAVCAAPLNPLRVCTSCGHHASLTAAQRIDQLADRGTFHEFDRHMWSGNPIQFSAGVTSYEKQLAQMQATTGLLDAVVTGGAQVRGIGVVAVVL